MKQVGSCVGTVPNKKRLATQAVPEVNMFKCDVLHPVYSKEAV